MKIIRKASNFPNQSLWLFSKEPQEMLYIGSLEEATQRTLFV
jgi:hypothetical protein